MREHYDLRPDINDRLGQLSGGLNRLGGRLEVPLCRDQVDQLFGDIHVGPFQRAGLDGTKAFGPGLTDQRLTRGRGFNECCVPNLLQAVLVVEVCQHQLAQWFVLTVGIVGAQKAGGINAKPVQTTGGETVLLKVVYSKRRREL